MAEELNIFLKQSSRLTIDRRKMLNITNYQGNVNFKTTIRYHHTSFTTVISKGTKNNKYC